MPEGTSNQSVEKRDGDLQAEKAGVEERIHDNNYLLMIGAIDKDTHQKAQQLLTKALEELDKKIADYARKNQRR